MPINELIENDSGLPIEELENYEVPDRLSWTSISVQIMSVLNIERGVFYTIIELLFRPGKAVRNHLYKNRSRLLNPVRFLVLSTTIMTFFTFYYLDFQGFVDGFESGMSMSTDESSRDIQGEKVAHLFLERFMAMIQQYSSIGYFIMVPVGALVSWGFSRKKYNVPELIVAYCFMWSMVNCISIVLIPFMGLEFSGKTIINGILALLPLIYPLYFYTKFINEGAKGLAKGIVIGIINVVLYTVLFGAATIYLVYQMKHLILPNSSVF